jgi:putative ABC transport system permease protein
MKKKMLRPLYTAWVTMVTHKLRSFLTILGVVIGVAAVIILMSVGKGTTANIISSISSLGTNIVYVQPGSSSSGGVRMGFGSASTITQEDAKAIANEISNITAVAPYATSNSQVIYGSNNMNVRITGVTVEYEAVLSVNLDDGEFFSQYQYDTKAKVAVIGSEVASTLFGEDYPIGEKIKMSNTVFTVIGLIKSSGSSISMNSMDQTILIPLTTLQGMMAKSVTATGQHTINSINVLVTDENMMDTVKADITTLLQTRHKIAFGDDNDFTVTSSDELISTISSSTESMTLLLGAIAGISLLVGGIGVMNIMLVSVMERRREIGIRKALGAQESAIWGQFLIDSALLTFAGGIIGVAIGWVIPGKLPGVDDDRRHYGYRDSGGVGLRRYRVVLRFLPGMERLPDESY